MRHPTFDSDGYPTDETLDAIRDWPHEDLRGLVSFAKEAFEGGGNYGWFENQASRIEPAFHDGYVDDGHWWCCATGGWSGCESVIGALQENRIFWFMCWRASLRGGYFEFHVTT